MKKYQTLKDSYKAFIPITNVMVNLINSSTAFVAVTITINIDMKYFKSLWYEAGLIIIIAVWFIWSIYALDKILKLKEQNCLEKFIIGIYVFIYVFVMLFTSFIS